MKPVYVVRCVVSVVVLATMVSVAKAEWPPKKLENLQVLPEDTKPSELLDMMGGFTRALGVRCAYCHVGDETLPLSKYSFASDDKPAKRKARVMLRMVTDLNNKYLPTLEERSEPPASIQCMTCHHGAPVPRTLQEILVEAEETGGLDSAIVTYRSLRDRYYGRATYDFGSVPLADVASEVIKKGRLDEGVALNALNVAMNPESEYAKRQHSSSAVLLAFRQSGADSGTAVYRDLKSRYGDSSFPEFLLNRIGYALLEDGHVESAIAAFRLNVEAFPNSSNTHDSLGDAYAEHGDRKLAIDCYEKALEISPSDVTKEKLEALRDKH